MYSLILLFLGITIWSYSQLGICGPPPLSPQKRPIFFSHIADEKIDEKKFPTNILCRYIFFGPVPSKDIQIPLPSEVKDLHLHER